MKTLEQRLGLGSVMAVSISSMLGSGIFVLPGLAAATTGPSTWLAYLIAAVGILPAALSKSELASAMPSSGGTYVYLERTFGPVAGSMAGIGLFLSLLLKSSFALVGFGAYLSVFTSINVNYLALALLGVIVFLNILGVGKVSGTLILVVSVAVTGLTLLFYSSLLSVDMSRFHPFLTGGFDGLLTASALVYVSFAGVTKIAAIAEEVKNPEVNVPRGILYSLFFITLIYCGINFAIMGNLSQEVVNGSLKPIYLLAQHIGGFDIGIGAAVVAIVTMTSMANAGLLAASRFPFAMSRDQLIPSIFGKIHPRFLTPIWSIVLAGALMGIAIMLLDVVRIAKLASSFMIMMFMMVNVAVVILRETRVQWYQPTYRSPLYPWMQVFGILLSLVMLLSMGRITLVAAMLCLVFGGVFYLLYGRRFAHRMGVVGVRRVRKDIVDEENPFDFNRRYLEFLHFQEDAKVVVGLFGKERSPETLIEMGMAISGGEKVEVAHMTEIPEQTSLSDISETPQIRSLRRRIEAMATTNVTTITFDPIVSHDIFKTMHELTQRVHCQWLVIEWVGKTRGAFTVHRPMGWLKDHLFCNLVTFRDSGVRYIRKILVLIKSDSYDRLVVSTADHLAQVYGAELTLYRVVSPDASAEAVQRERQFLEDIKKFCRAPAEMTIEKNRDVVDAVIEESEEFDLVVTGDLRERSIIDTFFGTEHDKLFAKVACSVVSILPGR